MIRKLYFQVLIAIALGVLLGHFAPGIAVAMKPFGDAFIALIRMLIAPLIFCTVITGIAGMEDMKKVGRTGGLALLYFEIVSSLALLVGLVIGHWVRPGAGMNIDPRSLDGAALSDYTRATNLHSVPDFLLGIIPSTLVEALARGDILQVLAVAVLFGFALHAEGGRESVLCRVIEQVSSVLFRIVSIVMRVAPLGAFGAMAFTIGRYGVGALTALAGFLACFYATCAVFVLLVLGLIARLHGFRIGRLIGYFREELLIVLGTSSSESVLPRMLLKLEALGVRRSVVDLVIPAGYSFNLDGTSIYLTLAVLFIAQATNTPLALSDELVLLVVLLLTSKGAAGVTGSGFIVLAATLSSVGKVPAAGLALIFGVDRFMSQARALTNLIGNAVATVVVGRWTGDVDLARLEQELARAAAADTAPP